MWPEVQGSEAPELAKRSRRTLETRRGRRHGSISPFPTCHPHPQPEQQGPFPPLPASPWSPQHLGLSLARPGEAQGQKSQRDTQKAYSLSPSFSSSLALQSPCPEEVPGGGELNEFLKAALRRSQAHPLPPLSSCVPTFQMVLTSGLCPATLWVPSGHR